MADLRRINHIMGETNAVYHDIWARMGLSDSVAVILYTLVNLGSAAPLSDITRLTGSPKQTLNSALRKLERQALVELRTAGGRKKLVCLTQKGLELAETTVCRVMELENSIFDGWSDMDLTTFVELNQRYLNQLREKTREL